MYLEVLVNISLCYIYVFFLGRRYIILPQALKFVEFLLFSVMASQFSQNQDFNFTIFAYLTLPRSSAKMMKNLSGNCFYMEMVDMTEKQTKV